MVTPLDHEIASLVDCTRLLARRIFSTHQLYYPVEEGIACNDDNLSGVLFAKALILQCNEGIKETVLDLERTLFDNGCCGSVSFVSSVATLRPLIYCCNDVSTNIAYLKKRNCELTRETQQLPSRCSYVDANPKHEQRQRSVSMTDCDIDGLITELKRYKIHKWKDDTFDDLSVPWEEKNEQEFQTNLDKRLEQLRAEGKQYSTSLSITLKKMPPKSTGRGARQGSTLPQSIKSTQRGLPTGAATKSPSHSLGNDHNELRQQLLREKEKVTIIEYEKNQLQERMKELQKQNTELEERLKHSQEDCRERDEMRQRCYLFESENAKLEKKLLRDQEIVKRLESEKKQLEDSIRNFEKEKRGLSDKYVKRADDAEFAKKEKANLAARMKELQKQNTDLEERLKHSQEDRLEKVELRQRCYLFESKNDKLEKQLLLDQETVKRLESEKNQLEDRFHSFQREKAEVEQKLWREKEAVTRAERKKNQLQKRSYLLGNDHTELRQQLLKENEKVTRLEYEKNQLQERFHSFEREKAEVEQKLWREKEAVTRIEREKNQLQERSHLLGDDHTEVKQQLFREKEKVTRLEYDKNQLQEK